MARQRGARTALAAVFETVYGTAPVSGFHRMPFASADLGAAQALQPSELLGYGRDPIPPVLDEVNADGDIVVPIDAASFGFWLKATLGAPVTTEDTGVYTHEFTSGKWVLPSFSVEKQMPDIPQFAMITGCKVNELRWTMQRSGLLQATARVIAQGENPTPTTSQAGVLAEYGIDNRFNHFHGAILAGGSPFANVTSADIMLMNDLDPVGTIRADGRIDGADEGMSGASGSITARFSDTSLINDAVAGTPVALTFSHTISADLSLTIEIARAYLSRPKPAIEGPQGVQVTFEWQGAQASNGGPMVTATLVNGVASY